MKKFFSGFAGLAIAAVCFFTTQSFTKKENLATLYWFKLKPAVIITNCSQDLTSNDFDLTTFEQVDKATSDPFGCEDIATQCCARGYTEAQTTTAGGSRIPVDVDVYTDAVKKTQNN